MGRKTKIALITNQCFTQKEQVLPGKNPVMTCNFCRKTYTKNVTRMCTHLLSCKSCPQSVKAKVQEDSKSTLIKKDMRHTANASSNSEPVQCQSSSSDDSDETMDTYIQNDTASTSNTVNTSCPTTQSTRPTNRWGKTHQSILKCSFDSIDQPVEDEIWVLISRACYASGQPLNFLRNKYWKELFQKLRPSLQLPSKQNLSNELLDREYDRIFATVLKKVQQASTIGIQIYGWTNIKNESMVSIILTTPEPVVYKIIDTKDNQHCPRFMADVIADIFRDVGLHRILSIVTDNPRNMTAANLLKTEHPDGIFESYGCAAHILNLLMKDIMDLNTFKECEQQCVAIVNNINNSHILSATLKMFQKDLTGAKSLKLPVKTRRGSTVMTLESILFSKTPLQNLALSEHLESIIDKSVKELLLRDEFWSQVNEIHKLLLPILLAIRRLEANTSKISIVVEIFHEILNLIQAASLAENEKLNILEYVKDRQKMALGPIQLAAYLLDPHYIGRYLTPDQYFDSLSYICKIGGFLYKDEEDTDKGIMYELATYKSKDDIFSKDFLWSALLSNDGGKLPPVVWWKSFCGHTKLSKIAIAILECSPTTSATERSFSYYGNPHTKARNHLSNERKAKLVYIKQNLKLADFRAQYDPQSSLDDIIPLFVESDEDNIRDHTSEESNSEDDW